MRGHTIAVKADKNIIKIYIKLDNYKIHHLKRLSALDGDTSCCRQFAGPVSYRKTTAIRRTCRRSEAQSRDLGAAKQHSGFVRACIRYPKVDRFLQERRRFTRQHGFTDDTCATDEEINQSIKITFRECKHSPGESTSPGRSSSVWTSTHFPRQ